MASSALNPTDSPLPSPVQVTISQFFMLGYKSTMDGFTLRCELGTIVSAILCGWVYNEAWRYFRNNRDPVLYRTIIAILVLGTAVGNVLGIIDTAIVVGHYYDYGEIQRRDMNLEYGKMVVASVLVAPITACFFNLRAWAVNGKTAFITALATFGVLFQLGAAIATIINGYQNPYHYDGTLNLGELAKVYVWSAKVIKFYRVWATITVVTNVGAMTAIFLTLAKFRGKTPEIDGFLKLLARSLAESMLPLVASSVTFCGLILANEGWGGHLRLISELVSPLCAHAVLHALLGRDVMRERLKSIAGLSITSGNDRDGDRHRNGRDSRTAGEYIMSQTGLGMGETEYEPTGNRDEKPPGMEGKNGYDLDMREVPHLSSSSSHDPTPLESSSRVPLRDSSEQVIRAYYRAWEDPVHQGFKSRGGYGFTLGSREYPAHREV